jgi:hypothetical protein
VKLLVKAWSAWAPGREDPEAWRAWAKEPVALPAEGTPNARFLPPMLRRRCTPLSKMMLRVAFDCVDESSQREVRTVFASRHGSINESLDLLRCVVEDAPLSPARFSHTVHNAQAGLFSIAAGNRQASASLAAQEDTLGCGFVEACTHLEREPGRPVLLVVGDAPLAETFAPLVDAPQVPYSLGLLLASDGEGSGIEFALSARRGPDRLVWPEALEWLRWWLGSEASLVLPGRRCGFEWRRAAAA